MKINPKNLVMYQSNNNFIILSVPLFAPDIVEKPRRI